ncbi:protein-L-isoaspartate(D-aspartate) O-methyltransferase [Conexibacter sp. SYSU D00693]|uniref:protein-L-isoaspartate(D-aspartate) O-methyltransferase n=1 Tax=Conexibacter sp. SYSU D00693 TaxID=2812560 RepID=UPI00196B98AE|nr:protein-L-isoaspartate(D-aspartate) O-methyltransferase [Conexibacter sp. SYSU D00693]
MPGARRRLLDGLAQQVGDERVLAALAAVPREAFVPRSLRAVAWEDRALPIGEGQTISQPLVVARMCALLELAGDERVLDVGTGSGYGAAVLGHLAAHVVSVERLAGLSADARRALERAGARRVELVVGDGFAGWPPRAPYDAVTVGAACPGAVPRALEEQLAPGGRLVAPVARRAGDDAQVLVRVQRHLDGTLEREVLDPVRFVPLVPGRA